MKSGRVLIGIFQKMRIKNLRSDLKTLDSFTLETSINHLIRIFLRNGRLRMINIILFIVVSKISPSILNLKIEHKVLFYKKKLSKSQGLAR